MKDRIQSLNDAQKFILFYHAFASYSLTKTILAKLASQRNLLFKGQVLTTTLIPEVDESLSALGFDIEIYNREVSSTEQCQIILAMVELKELEAFFDQAFARELDNSSYNRSSNAKAALFRASLFCSGIKIDPELLMIPYSFTADVLFPKCHSREYFTKIKPSSLVNFLPSFIHHSRNQFFQKYFLGNDSDLSFCHGTITETFLQIAKAIKERDFIKYLEVLENFPSDNLHYNLVLGSALFIKGEYALAVKAFQKELKLLKSLGLEQKITGFFGAFYNRALTFSGLKTHRTQLLKGYDAKAGFAHLNSYIASSQLPPKSEKNFYYLSKHDDIYGYLEIYISNRGLHEEYVEELELSLQHYENAPLFYRDALAMLLVSGREKYREQYEALNKRYPFPACVDFIQFQEEWDELLTNVEKVFSLNADEAEENTERLTWRLNVSSGEVTPYAQKKNKTGWTPGRQIALKRLGEFDSLLTEDMAIMRHIYEEHNYWEREYFLKLPDAYQDLKDHPYLFNSRKPHNPIELQAEKISVDIQENADFITLRLPSSSYEDKAKIIKLGPNRYSFWEDSDDLKKLRTIIPLKGLKVPSRARERVMKVVSPMLKNLKVNTNLNGNFEGCEKLDADAKIYCTAFPDDTGIHFEFTVRPLGEKTEGLVPGQGQPLLLCYDAQCERDLVLEKAEITKIIKLSSSFRNFAKSNYSKTITNTDKALSALAALKDNQIDILWPKERVKMTSSSQASVSLNVEEKADWFGVDGEVQFGDQSFALAHMLEMLKTEQSYIKLSDKSFLQIGKELRKKLKDIAALTTDSDAGLKLPKLMQNDFDQITSDMDKVKLPTDWSDNIKDLNKIFKTTYKVPKTFKANLRDYQNEGFQWLSKMADWGVGACLADDMGLGKTIQALALLVDRAKHGPSLVVAPTSVCGNWYDECKKFAPTLKPIIYDGKDRDEILDTLKKGDLLLCSYNVMQIDGKMLKEVDWNIVVLDEAQAIKNAASQRSRTARALKAKFKLATTGTPLENHLGELWALFDFINPGHLGGSTYFSKEFRLQIEKYHTPWVIERLKRRIQPFILRRLKKDVLKELPPRTEVVLKVEMEEDEKHFYDAVRLRAVHQLSEKEDIGEDVSKLAILAEITRLRRACCNPRLIDDKSRIKSSKEKVFMRTVQDLIDNNHRALVFSQFTSHFALIREALDEAGISYLYLDGSTPARKRKVLVNQFQDGNAPLFLISLKAGGSGLNLTGASYVIHLDPWWNPAVEDQATDRAHRMGQDKSVTVYRLIAEGSIEEKILELHEEKRSLADGLLSESSVASSLDAKALMSLLKDEE